MASNHACPFRPALHTCHPPIDVVRRNHPRPLAANPFIHPLPRQSPNKILRSLVRAGVTRTPISNATCSNNVVPQRTCYHRSVNYSTWTCIVTVELHPTSRRPPCTAHNRRHDRAILVRILKVARPPSSTSDGIASPIVFARLRGSKVLAAEAKLPRLSSAGILPLQR